jgi:hypothetical protein
MISASRTVSFDVPDLNSGKEQTASPVRSVIYSFKNIIGGSKNTYKAPEN